MREIAMNRTETTEERAARMGFWQRTRRLAGSRWRSNPVPWASIAIVLLVTAALPTVIDVLVGSRYPRMVEMLHYFISTVYLITSIMIVWEACAAWKNPVACPESATPPFPRCTAIVAAFLPNEQGIILETLTHILSTVAVPHDNLEVILAYNTPNTLPVEDELRTLAASDPRLFNLKVVGSTSKAENINAAVAIATGEIIAVYDADHLPAADCFQRAWGWLANGYDMVQGRCVIRNGKESVLTGTVDIEFDTMYAISHQGRCGMSRTAIFGGSNGYWRSEVLRNTPMNPEMLTEDIDVSVRALLDGCRLVHDRGIISEELAPSRFAHWLMQRKRWSQGWLEVTLKHQRDLMRTKHLGPWQKFLWFYLLGWRECYPVLSVQIVPLIVAAWILRIPIQWIGNSYFLDTTIITLASGPIALLITYLRGGNLRKGRGFRYLLYGLFGIFYTAAKTLVTLVAQYSHFTRDKQWIITPR